jgi:selenide, water dikinase
LKTDLLSFADQGGCSSKIPPAQLEEILKYLPVASDPDILVNIDTHDDAGVYRLTDTLALVLTTDFFPPMVSDPFEFGQIAAANSISDVYAMGGRPALALNIMMFPAAELPMETYAEILRGGFEKAAEAGVKIIGGHTIDDQVPKYGLAVTGFINPADLATNAGARPGDMLILTKPIGTGIQIAGKRLGMAEQTHFEEAKRLMKLLNDKSAEILVRHKIKGATDITGFGLAGHTLKMARASKVTISLRMSSVPLIGNTLSLVEEGCIPGTCFTNLDYAEKDIRFSGSLGYDLKMTAFDAQTSGGLLLSVAGTEADRVLTELRNEGLTRAEIIGEVLPPAEKLLYLAD